MAQGRLHEDLLFTGDVVFAGQVVLPTATIRNDHVRTDAAVGAEKLQHQNISVWSQSGTMATERRAVYVAKSAGQLQYVKAGCRTACTGDATLTIQVKVNGADVLSSGIVLDSSTTPLTLVNGALATAAYSANAIIEVDVTADSGTGTLGSGAFVTLCVREAA